MYAEMYRCRNVGLDAVERATSKVDVQQGKVISRCVIIGVQVDWLFQEIRSD